MTGTTTDAGATEWRIDDDVFQLRQWGTDIAYALPASATELVIGAADDCAIRLADPFAHISRHHARLVREQGRWGIKDLKSKNGLHVDGLKRGAAALEGGLELGIGGVTLIAESRRFVELRAFVSRMLGWGADRIGRIDHALRAIRACAARRGPLVLSGDGDLVAMRARPSSSRPRRRQAVRRVRSTPPPRRRDDPHGTKLREGTRRASRRDGRNAVRVE